MKESFKFLLSAINKNAGIHNIEFALDWIKKQNSSVSVSVEKISFPELKNWIFDENSIRHTSGRFFSILGIHVKTDWFYNQMTEWYQPIINQPEIGYLGFIVKEINGVFHFLVQAKVEPGNVNHVQLSPTIQATKSNYQKVHEGKTPAYLDYFKNVQKEDILLDQLQSEQGGRFLKKRNRNIIIRVSHEVELLDNFKWLTLYQIKQLMQIDNLVNMDTRTVLSGIHYGSYNSEILEYLSNEFSLTPIGRSLLRSYGDFSSLRSSNLLSELTSLKSRYDLILDNVPLSNLRQWVYTEHNIYHQEKRYFEVIPVRVSINNREVTSWDQPMVRPLQEGLCALVCQIIDGKLFLILQSKMECGNHDVIEFAPTIQTLTGDYKEVSVDKIPFLKYVLSAPKDEVVLDTIQSEEGGRFYKEQNRNMVVLMPGNDFLSLPDNFHYCTLADVADMLRFNNLLNIQVRNLISTLTFV